jgi:hypothetical protein
VLAGINRVPCGWRLLSLGVLLSVAILMPTGSFGQPKCRSVDENAHLAINPKALADLKPLGIGREEVMAAIRETSRPETQGCWGGAIGDFDGQKMSVGVAQWNYGTKSLQPLLRRFHGAYKPEDMFQQVLAKLAPEHGRRLFSNGCLGDKLTKECVDFLDSQQMGGGKLREPFRVELNAIFESDQMTQIQADVFVTILTSVASDIGRIFSGKAATPQQVKWAIDTKVQQGGFPGDEDIDRVRQGWRQLDQSERQKALLAVVRWYEGLCSSSDQEGVRHDCSHNVRVWAVAIGKGKVSDDSADLILLSHLKSRTARTKSGLYQADAFQRRAKIAFGEGSVHGRRD